MRLPAAIAGGVVYLLPVRVFHRPTLSCTAELYRGQVAGNGVDADKFAPVPGDRAWAWVNPGITTASGVQFRHAGASRYPEAFDSAHGGGWALASAGVTARVSTHSDFPLTDFPLTESAKLLSIAWAAWWAARASTGIWSRHGMLLFFALMRKKIVGIIGLKDLRTFSRAHQSHQGNCKRPPIANTAAQVDAYHD